MTEHELPPSNQPAPDASSVANYERLPLLGALLKFNVKLIANGMLDLVLLPAAFFAVTLGIAMGGSEPGRYFRELMAFGRRTEGWINLFGGHGDAERRSNIDVLLGAYEKEVAAVFERRGWSAPTEAALRKASLGRAAAQPGGADSGSDA